jgi:hypothetical protein
MLFRQLRLWLCALLIGVSAPASAQWVPMTPGAAMSAFEISTDVARAAGSFWTNWVQKVKWRNMGVRTGVFCVVTGVGSTFISTSFGKQKTWWLKGLRMLSSCGAGMAAAPFFEGTTALLALMGAPELVAFGGSLLVGGLVGGALQWVVERLWVAHSVAVNRHTRSGGNIAGHRSTLEVYDDEYWASSMATTLTAGTRHPSSRWPMGRHIRTSTAIRVGTDQVGGTWFPSYVPPASCR